MYIYDTEEQAAISIHAPREGGDLLYVAVYPESSISIHAPREGGDAEDLDQEETGNDISIHAPREGGDRMMQGIMDGLNLFQSTPPARGATVPFL